MKKYIDVLSRCALFDRIEEEKLLLMLNCLGAKVSAYDKKYTIFAEGQPARHIGIMLSGSAQVVQMDYYGNRSIVAGASACETIGEAFACAEVKALPVSIIANEPSEVMLIDCGHILHTCSNNCDFHQQLIYNLMKLMATNNLLFHQKIEITSKRSTREKLLAYLNSCAKKNGSNSFDVPFDRQDLADYLEVDRSGLSSEIGKLKREGVIDNHRRHFELL